jgi:hypothetical protein
MVLYVTATAALQLFVSPEYSGFAVDGRPDLGMIVYNPVDPDVAEHIRSLLAG